MNQRREDRLQIPALGEYYDDVLDIDAELSNRTKVQQAQSLISEKLQERLVGIRERIQYLADKRGITFNQMWGEILAKRGKSNVFTEGAVQYQPGDEG
ncbi:MAG: hypothetical protein IGS39_04160 [Calothrix sp. C42_A2020_038]|nr:hypothetical protein [Calothrix sp. C42_A2020_038]